MTSQQWIRYLQVQLYLGLEGNLFSSEQNPNVFGWGGLPLSEYKVHFNHIPTGEQDILTFMALIDHRDVVDTAHSA